MLGDIVVRRRPRARIACALVALAVALAGCGGSEVGATGGMGGSWSAANADLGNTRHAGGRIDAASVRRLQMAWAVTFPNMVSNPVIARQVVYAQDGISDVFAFRLRDGALLWRRLYQDATVGPNGVAVGDGRVYGATSTSAFALDARTGRQLWIRRLVASRQEGIDMAPGLWNRTVYVSTVPVNVRTTYGAGARGVLWALDAATGRPRWSWATVPAALWGRPDLNAGGGLWEPPAFDGRGFLYAAIGNPAPWSGVPGHPWGSSRPGPNRWTDSIVKLDARTGRFVWGRQVLPHDLFDWDLEGPVILARANGRPLAVTAGKMGFVFAFDQADGRLLWKRSVGIHNGHDGDGRKTMRDARALPAQERVLPGQLGGVETPMSVDGDTVYVPVENLYSVYRATGRGQSGPIAEGRGEVVALDLASGRVKWDRALPASVFSATTVVNDLVFAPTVDGTVWALRARDGAVAWRGRLTAGTNAPVAIAGDTLLAGAGLEVAQGQTPTLAAFRLRR